MNTSIHTPATPSFSTHPYPYIEHLWHLVKIRHGWSTRIASFKRDTCCKVHRYRGVGMQPILRSHHKPDQRPAVVTNKLIKNDRPCMMHHVQVCDIPCWSMWYHLFLLLLLLLHHHHPTIIQPSSKHHPTISTRLPIVPWPSFHRTSRAFKSIAAIRHWSNMSFGMPRGSVLGARWIRSKEGTD